MNNGNEFIAHIGIDKIIECNSISVRENGTEICGRITGSACGYDITIAFIPSSISVILELKK